jgi:hypothetical protein
VTSPQRFTHDAVRGRLAVRRIETELGDASIVDLIRDNAASVDRHAARYLVVAQLMPDRY